MRRTYYTVGNGLPRNVDAGETFWFSLTAFETDADLSDVTPEDGAPEPSEWVGFRVEKSYRTHSLGEVVCVGWCEVGTDGVVGNGTMDIFDVYGGLHGKLMAEIADYFSLTGSETLSF